MLFFTNILVSNHDLAFFKKTAPYTPYFAHLESYKKKLETNKDAVLVLCFEDMKKNPRKVIKDIAQFLKVPLSDEQVERIARKTSFKKMKENPNSNYEHWNELGIRNKDEAEFMRKGTVNLVSYFCINNEVGFFPLGEVGDYVNHLSEDMNATFDEWIDANKPHPFEFKFKI